MRLDKGRYEVEEARCKIDEKRCQLEGKRVRLDGYNLAIRVVTLFLALFSLWFAYNKYSEQKEKEHIQEYQRALATLESGDVSLQKAALLELAQFRQKYTDIVPILIDFMQAQRAQGKTSLEPYLITSFLLIGQPLVERLAQENRVAYKHGDSSRLDATVWAIGELLKRDIGGKVGYVDLHDIFIEDLKLSNISISEISLAGARIEHTNFDGTYFKGVDLSAATFEKLCSFWQSRFDEKTNLRNTTFVHCILDNSYFETDLTETRFPQSTVLDVGVTKKLYVSEGTFEDSEKARIYFAEE